MKIKDFLYRRKTSIEYAASSLISFAIDYGIYTVLLAVFKMEAYISYVIARGISSVINFTLNKCVVFRSRQRKLGLLKELVGYYALAVLIMLAGGALTKLAVDGLGFNGYVTKLIIDPLLFVVNYLIQKFLIFKKAKA